MTAEQNQKRIFFIEHIKKNYSAIHGYQLIFYFEDYDIAKITAAEYHPVGATTREYVISRSDQDCGAVIMTHDFSNHMILYLSDKYFSILYDVTLGCIIDNDLKVPIDLEQLRKELQQLYLALKSK